MNNKQKENPFLLEELEEELKKISGGVRRLLAGKVTRRAIILLIHDSIPATEQITKKIIDQVVTAIEGLDSRYLKKKIK